MIPIPEFLRRMALSAGCPADEVDELWERHTELCDQDRSDYGGARWKGLVDAHVKRERVPTLRRDDPEARAARQRESDAKAIEDAEYRKGAMSLSDWLGDLRTRDDFGEQITEWDRAIATFRNPLPGEERSAWLLAAAEHARRELARVR